MASSGMADRDAAFMKRALREAVKGRGRTSPNPLVGAVIVKNGRVVGRGYHKKAGTPHAEVNAIQDAGAEARGATIYVTLEPCNHQGRTPPCTEAILRAGLRRVVIGMPDPNPQVAGGGSRYLTTCGLEVCSGILDAECRRINRPFVKLVTTGRPWVIMKAALSLDGRIAVASGQPGWISNKKSRRYTHRMRGQVDGILIGIGTALADDPSLTTRLPGPKRRDPVRIVLDVNLRLPTHARMLGLDSKAETLVFCGPCVAPAKMKSLSQAGAVPIVTPLDTNGRIDLKEVLLELGRRHISSLLVEGGSLVHSSFLAQELVDQLNLFYGPFFIGGDGVPVAGEFGLQGVEQARRLKEITTRRFDNDLMIEGYF